MHLTYMHLILVILVKQILSFIGPISIGLFKCILPDSLAFKNEKVLLNISIHLFKFTYISVS